MRSFPDVLDAGVLFACAGLSSSIRFTAFGFELLPLALALALLAAGGLSSASLGDCVEAAAAAADAETGGGMCSCANAAAEDTACAVLPGLVLLLVVVEVVEAVEDAAVVVERVAPELEPEPEPEPGTIPLLAIAAEYGGGAGPGADTGAGTLTPPEPEPAAAAGPRCARGSRPKSSSSLSAEAPPLPNAPDSSAPPALAPEAEAAAPPENVWNDSYEMTAPSSVCLYLWSTALTSSPSEQICAIRVHIIYIIFDTLRWRYSENGHQLK